MNDISREVSAGGVLVRDKNGHKEALLMKIRHYGYEIPKGHIEAGESSPDAAARELCEETSLLSKPVLQNSLGDLEYSFRFENKNITKRVYYFLFTTAEAARFGQKPKEVKELKWISLAELDKLPLVNEELRNMIRLALTKQ